METAMIRQYYFVRAEHCTQAGAARAFDYADGPSNTEDWIRLTIQAARTWARSTEEGPRGAFMRRSGRGVLALAGR